MKFAFHFSPATLVVVALLSLSLLPHRTCWGFDLDACHACFGGAQQNGCTYCVKDTGIHGRVEMCDCDEEAVQLYGDCSVYKSTYIATTNMASGCSFVANPGAFVKRILLFVLFFLLLCFTGCVGCLCYCCNNNSKPKTSRYRNHEMVSMGSGTMTAKGTYVDEPKEII
jgi:hypothetical protein